MKSNGVATILLMIPVLTVPALAIFGIPQFAPVVASPVGEGDEFDRDTRLGSSTRTSRAESFDDFEGFESDRPEKSGSLAQSANRDSSRLAANRENGRENPRRRSAESNPPAWGDDLAAGSDWPGRSRRTQTPESDESTPLDRSSVERNLQAMSGRGIPQRYERRSRPAGDLPSASRSADPEELDQGIVQAGFVEDAPEPEPRRVTPPNRSRAVEPRNPGRREPATDSLTWAAAVERLNECDIRNFRLEPGDRAGQFVFICTYASPEAPSVSYRFEAGADEPLKAVEKVLEQIVAWRQKQ